MSLHPSQVLIKPVVSEKSYEQITRNHRCASIEELVKLTMAWLDGHGAFKIEGRMYKRLKATA